MELESLQMLAQQGPVAFAFGIILWFVLTQFKALQSELVQIVRGNTEALTEIREAIDRLEARIDALGFRTTMAYDALGRQVAVQTPLGYRSTTVYDAAGQTAAQIDALGYHTSFGYDAAGNRVTMMDANGYVSTSVYYNNSNLQQAQIDALERRTTFSLWDVNCRIGLGVGFALTHVAQTRQDLSRLPILFIHPRLPRRRRLIRLGHLGDADT